MHRRMKSKFLSIAISLAVSIPAFAGTSAAIDNIVYEPTITSDSSQNAPASEDQIATDSYNTQVCRSDRKNISENAWPADMVTGTLPVVYINTQDAAPIVDKVNPIPAGYYMDPMGSDYAAEGSAQEPITLTIRGRGNSTWLQPKKPYKLKSTRSRAFSAFPRASITL